MYLAVNTNAISGRSKMVHVLDGFDEDCFDIEEHFEFLVPYEKGKSKFLSLP